MSLSPDFIRAFLNNKNNASRLTAFTECYVPVAAIISVLYGSGTYSIVVRSMSIRNLYKRAFVLIRRYPHLIQFQLSLLPFVLIGQFRSA